MADQTGSRDKDTHDVHAYQGNLHDDLMTLTTMLLAERTMHGNSLMVRPSQASGDAELWGVFRALVNTREPWPADPQFLEVQDRLLHALIEGAVHIDGVNDDGITTVDSDGQSHGGISSVQKAPLDPAGRLLLWRGDITRLGVDAIVNAANSQMLGCWQPGHFCIDNAIHTFAGVQLRLACAKLMARKRQQFGDTYEEPTAQAEITKAFNLPSRHVIHTVGPIAQGSPTKQHREQLAQCYRACLDAARGAGDKTVAFCSISTGVFGFPIEQAAPIAIEAVRSWLDDNTSYADNMHIIFNVFSFKDELIYRPLLKLEL